MCNRVACRLADFEKVIRFSRVWINSHPEYLEGALLDDLRY